MLHSILEESGGSNGSRSLRYRPELDLYHERALGLVFPYKCFAFISLRGSQWSHTQHSLGADWKVFLWLLLSKEEWGCLRDTETSPFVEILKNPHSWVQEALIGDPESPSGPQLSHKSGKSRLADLHHSSSGSWSYSQVLNGICIKTEVCP